MKYKILIVDNEADFAEMLKARLVASGYDVIIATDGQRALRKKRKEKPDLLILDLMMPELNGYGVCREIRRKDNDQKTPIIMLTGKDKDADRIQGKVIGADIYLTKPCDSDVLLKKIDQLLKNIQNENTEGRHGKKENSDNR